MSPKRSKTADIDDGGQNLISQLEITLKLTETTYQRQKKLWSKK